MVIAKSNRKISKKAYADIPESIPTCVWPGLMMKITLLLLSTLLLAEQTSSSRLREGFKKIFKREPKKCDIIWTEQVVPQCETTNEKVMVHQHFPMLNCWVTILPRCARRCTRMTATPSSLRSARRPSRRCARPSSWPSASRSMRRSATPSTRRSARLNTHRYIPTL